MNTCPKCYGDNPSEANFCMNCGTKLISSDDLFAENAKIKRQFLAMQSDNLMSKKIIEDNTDAHTIFYGSIKKIEHEWIDQNAISHEFANGFGKIKLNDEVTEIEDFVSQDCEELYYITIPNGITAIKDYAISSCEIKSIFIPSSVTEISESAFFCCNKLLSIVVDKRNKVYDSRDNCNAIIETEKNKLIVGCQNTIIPNSVTEIGKRAFYNCELTSLVIPDSIIKIGREAFHFCNITDLVIPNSVVEIEDKAFYGCDLTSVLIPDSVNRIGEDAFSGAKNIVYHGTAPTETCGALTVNGYVDGDLIYLNNTKTTLTGCNRFAQKIDIPNSVVEIGDYAFSRSHNLTSVNIPNSVLIIGNGAFGCCENLEYVVIPDSVIWIGGFIFSGCENITEPIYNKNCFAHFPSILYATEYAIPFGIQQIAGSAFSNCSWLKSIDIPDSVTEIGEWAFSGCKELESLVIPDFIDYIGAAAFEGCEALKSIVLPNSLKKIEDFTFSNCKKLASIIIPDSITEIGSCAFTYCNSMESVVIPDSVTKFGSCIFRDCKKQNIPIYNAHSFVYFPPQYGIEYTIPDGIQQIVGGAFEECFELESVVIPESVTKICCRAFYGCYGLSSINIPDSVTEIEPTAFACCDKIPKETREKILKLNKCAFDFS